MIPDRDKWPVQAEMFINRVKKNERKLRAWRKIHQVSCYRLYHLDIPEIPLLVDWYEGRLHIATRHRPHEALSEWVAFLAEGLAKELAVKKNDVFIKQRKLGRGGTQYGVMARTQRVFEITENGLIFLINLSDYLDTGLFLDHRTTRRMILEEAKHKHFLNLFSYTGSFSVYAAAGGAHSTTTVDLSNTYLETAEKNMRRNGFGGRNHEYIKTDVLKVLRQKGLKSLYDLVVMDAPTVSKSKAMDGSLDIQKDYAWMLNALLGAVTPKGVIYFSCNLSDFEFSANMVKASEISDITRKTVPRDFKGKNPHKCFRIVK